MIKKLLIILFLLIAIPCWGATKQVMVFGTDDNIDTSVTEYFPLAPVGSGTWQSTETTTVWPASGTITDLFVELDVNPGAGKTSQWTIRVNKATPGTPTRAVCTNVTACNDSTNATTISAGDEVSIEHDPISAPATSDPSWSIVWNPTTSDYTVIVGSTRGQALATSGTQYLPMHAFKAPESVAFDVSTLFPTGGTLRDLYIVLETDPGDGTTRTFAFGTVDCTITGSAGGTNKTCNSGADTQAVSANDVFTLTSTVSGTPAASTVRYGIVFVPTTSGEFTFHGVSDDTTSGGTGEFNWLATVGTGTGNWTGTTTVRENLAGVGFTMKNIYFELAGDVGPDEDVINLFFRVDESNSALTCQATGAGAGPWRCNAATSITVSSGEELSVAATNGGTTPLAQKSRWAFTGFITPTGGAARRVFTTH